MPVIAYLKFHYTVALKFKVVGYCRSIPVRYTMDALYWRNHIHPGLRKGQKHFSWRIHYRY